MEPKEKLGMETTIKYCNKQQVLSIYKSFYAILNKTMCKNSLVQLPTCQKSFFQMLKQAWLFPNQLYLNLER